MWLEDANMLWQKELPYTGIYTIYTLYTNKIIPLVSVPHQIHHTTHRPDEFHFHEPFTVAFWIKEYLDQE